MTRSKLNVPQRTLTDIRDGETYRVRKLADGNCWMTENLRLVGPKSLTSDTTDVGVGETFNLPAQKTGVWCVPSSAEDGACYSQVQSVSSGNNTYGMYYSWAAATAGSGTYDTENGTDVPYSVCPKNWRLPTAKAYVASDYRNLFITYGIDTLAKATAFPTEFVLSGDRFGGSNRYQGSSGSWWSSSAYEVEGDHVRAHNAYITEGRILPVNQNGKELGLAVRCITK